MTDILIQCSLALFGLSAIYMATGHNARARRWAPVVGLCGQPAWLYFAATSNAWGLFLLSLVYSAVYVRGIALQWRRAAPSGA